MVFVFYGLAIWLFPYVIIVLTTLGLFIKHDEHLRKNPKNIKCLFRETFDIRYLIPIANWWYMSSLVLHRDFIEAFLLAKLIKNTLDKDKKV